MTTSAQPHDGGPQRFVLDPRGPATFQADQPAGGTVPYVIDASACTLSVWRPDATYPSGALLRPTLGRQTGLVYASIGPGQSGPLEPTWPTTVGDTVIDGSLTLTATGEPAAWGADSIRGATWTQIDPPDDALTITDTTTDSVTASAFIGGGTSGNVYTVQAVISMSSGSVYPATLALTVV